MFIDILIKFHKHLTSYLKGFAWEFRRDAEISVKIPCFSPVNFTEALQCLDGGSSLAVEGSCTRGDEKRGGDKDYEFTNGEGVMVLWVWLKRPRAIFEYM